METKQVTAQDFWKAFHSQVSKLTEHYLVESGDDVVENITAQFDALLSRARQEARREALKEMDEAWTEYVNQNESYEDLNYTLGNEACQKLRQEYQTN